MWKWIFLAAFALSGGAFSGHAEAQACMEEVKVELYWGGLSCQNPSGTWLSDYVQSDEAERDRGQELCLRAIGSGVGCCWDELPYTRYEVEQESVPHCQLGGLDLHKTCRIQTGNRSAYAILKSDPYAKYAAYGWACVSNSRRTGIDMQRACRDEYPGRSAYAKAANLNNAYSWSCYTGE